MTNIEGTVEQVQKELAELFDNNSGDNNNEEKWRLQNDWSEFVSEEKCDVPLVDSD